MKQIKNIQFLDLRYEFEDDPDFIFDEPLEFQAEVKQKKY